MITMGMTGRKWRIFLHAVDLFSTRGYSNISMRDIAAAEGIKVASIYNHFESKESILETIFDYDEFAHNILIPYLETLPPLAADPGIHPIGIFYGLHVHPDLETRALRNKITAVAVAELYNHSRADDLLRRDLIRDTKNYGTKILEALYACGRIGLMDIETFINIYTNYTFAAAILATTKESITTEQWKAGVELLMTMIPLIEPVSGAIPEGMFRYLDELGLL